MNTGYHNHKEFKCPYCPKDFKKKRQLKQHVKDSHGKKGKDNERK